MSQELTTSRQKLSPPPRCHPFRSGSEEQGPQGTVREEVWASAAPSGTTALALFSSRNALRALRCIPGLRCMMVKQFHVDADSQRTWNAFEPRPAHLVAA